MQPDEPRADVDGAKMRFGLQVQSVPTAELTIYVRNMPIHTNRCYMGIFPNTPEEQGAGFDEDEDEAETDSGEKFNFILSTVTSKSKMRRESSTARPDYSYYNQPGKTKGRRDKTSF
ncbi:hypothetical protein EYC84_007771 [Monilinia fructicola]|uniref:Uncharacterized protein n=1 Tax=Monilinia fructicola TaxID=38448 RepID=A0A5M9JK71_MONFR|nr:hypothetical protein EYC84_007771 [Monilinia fructicola]